MATDAPFLLHDLIAFEGKDLNRTDFDAEDAPFAVEFIPDHIQS
jgi:hypothetical protein